MAGFILLTRSRTAGSWPLLFGQAIVAALIYATLFVRFAISRTERDWYFNKLKEVFRRRSVRSKPANELSMNS